MPTCPNCGSYVSPGTNVCSCGTTFGSSSLYSERKREPTEYQRITEEKRKTVNTYCRQAKAMMKDCKYLDAIHAFDRALEVSPKSHMATFGKAKSYYHLGRYEEALDLFRKAKYSIRCIDNIVELSWIGFTLNRMRRFDEAIWTFRQAIEIINEDYESKINFYRQNRWDVLSDEYPDSLLREKNERVSWMEENIARSMELKSEPQSEHDREVEILKDVGRENLITIAGSRFHGNFEFEKDMSLKLVREKDNEYDSDAIAVYFEDSKVGYVANSPRTSCMFTSMASDVYVFGFRYAEYLMNHEGYHIARLI